jgi:hypothetical protein
MCWPQLTHNANQVPPDFESLSREELVTVCKALWQAVQDLTSPTKRSRQQRQPQSEPIPAAYTCYVESVVDSQSTRTTSDEF